MNSVQVNEKKKKKLINKTLLSGYSFTILFSYKCLSEKLSLSCLKDWAEYL